MSAISLVSEKAIRFLNESNRIEGINDIDYHDQIYQDPSKGHFGAFTDSQQSGVERKAITSKMIRNWQALIGREQKERTGDYISDEEIGHIRGPNLQKNVRIGNHIPPEWKFVPLYLQNFIEDVNADLKAHYEVYSKDECSFARFAATFFLRFERIHPFGDGNGRTGRLLANYFAAYCNHDILVFPSEYALRNRYIEAHNSDDAMTAYFQKHLLENSSKRNFKMAKVA